MCINVCTFCRFITYYGVSWRPLLPVRPYLLKNVLHSKSGIDNHLRIEDVMFMSKFTDIAKKKKKTNKRMCQLDTTKPEILYRLYVILKSDLSSKNQEVLNEFISFRLRLLLIWVMSVFKHYSNCNEERSFFKCNVTSFIEITNASTCNWNSYQILIVSCILNANAILVT